MPHSTNCSIGVLVPSLPAGTGGSRELMTMYEDAIERTMNQAGTDPEAEGAGGKTWMLWAAAGVGALATAAVLSYLKDDGD